MTNAFKTGRVQAVYVIHDRRFADRAEHMEAQLGRFDIPFEYILNHDATTITPELRHRFTAADYDLANGKLSCALKHFDALRRIATGGFRRALVLEDDAILEKDFHGELLAILEECLSFSHPFTVQLGCANNRFTPRSRLRPGQRLYEAGEVRANEAFLINAAAAQLRLDWFEHNKLSHSTDCTFNIVDHLQGIRTYWAEPTVVVQGSATGRFASHLDIKQMKRPLWMVRARFWLQRLRKKHVYGRLQ